MKHVSALLFAAVLALSSQAVSAQSVQQSGPVTPRHAACWTTTGVAQDCGTSTAGYPSTFGLSQQGGKPFCITNLSLPPPYPAVPYSQLCFGISLSGAYLTLDSYAGASNLPFSLIINGITYPFPVGTGLGGLRVVTSGTSDSMTSGDVNGTIAWSSTSTANKAETLLPCNSLSNGNRVTIADQAATASTYPILLTASSGTVGGQTSFIMPFSRSANSFQCNGSTTDWIPL